MIEYDLYGTEDSLITQCLALTFWKKKNNGEGSVKRSLGKSTENNPEI